VGGRVPAAIWQTKGRRLRQKLQKKRNPHIKRAVFPGLTRKQKRFKGKAEESASQDPKSREKCKQIRCRANAAGKEKKNKKSGIQRMLKRLKNQCRKEGRTLAIFGQGKARQDCVTTTNKELLQGGWLQHGADVL